ncbi:MAG: hypothetical protein JOZ48_06135 [Acidobacteriaceae bacterium]|nr:hypothetical protein [Acidobacteriaceae bacterium]
MAAHTMRRILVDHVKGKKTRQARRRRCSSSL